MKTTYLFNRIYNFLFPGASIINACKNMSLPPTHPKRIAAQKIIDEEYGECFKLEADFNKRWFGYYSCFNIQEAFDITQEICKIAGVCPIKTVKLAEHKEYSAYHPFKKRIKLSTAHIEISSLLHEIAHHIHCHKYVFNSMFGGYHNKVFLDIEKSLFDTLLELQKGKKKYNYSAIELLKEYNAL